MANLDGRQIRDLARRIIGENPGGIRYTPLVDRIWQPNPETPKSRVYNCVWDLDRQFPDQIAKPSRGLFTPINGSGDDAVILENSDQVAPTGARMSELDFYDPFAQWLKNDLDEVTEVAPFGGAGLKSKWGTPDVIGVYKPSASNLIKFPIEIVSAEIKIDPQTPVVAFGQAIAYRLFSTKTYIAMPLSLTEEDQGRLESLCILFGVGLVLFRLDIDSPQFSIRVRAQRFSPDMFYVNEFAERLKQHNNEVFEQLFR